MDWTWNWWLFVAALVMFTILRELSRGATSDTKATRYGERAGPRKDFGLAFFGSVLVGAVYAAIATAAIGFVL